MRLLVFILLLLSPSLALAQSGVMSGGTVKATGSTVYRTLADRFGDSVNAKDFGAMFDGVRVSSGGSIAANSTTFNWSGGSFTAADVGKRISIDAAGPNGNPLNATIAAYNSATQVVLANAASSAVPGSYWNPFGAWAVSAAGSGYAPGDQITLAGGTSTFPTVLLVTSTKAVSGAVVSGGTGGTNGACTVTGTTGLENGTSTPFQLSGTVTGGALAGSLTVAVAGLYRDNPTDITNEPVTGCGLTGATVSVSMGVDGQINIYPGAYSVRPSDPIGQASSTGSGTGVTFTGAWTTSQTFRYGTDDTAAIQAAINYCAGKVVNFSGGCRVLLPSGTSMISSGLTVNKQEVSLVSLNNSLGFAQRNVTGAVSQSFPTRLLYAGANNPGYMLTEAPLISDGKQLYGNDIKGIMFDCNGTPGCGGVEALSLNNATVQAAVSEPFPRAYTTSGATTAGSQSMTVSDATGITVGETVWTPNVLSGTYVANISGNTLTLSSQAYGSGVASGAVVYLGGEGWRFDSLDGLNPSGTQNNDLWLYSRNLNTVSPCVAIGGSDRTGPAYVNASLNRFWDVACSSYVADTVDANNSDHNYWFTFAGANYVPNTTTVGAAFVGNGSLDPNNGSNRYNWFFSPPGRRAIVFRGSSVGGFTAASVYNTAQWSVTSAVPVYSVDTAGGAQLCVSNDNQPAIGCIGGQAVTASAPDNTTVGGNSRGTSAVDLQLSRTSATQVANGANSTISGGTGNTASGTTSVVSGGSGNTSSGTGAAVIGGSGNTSSNTNSIAGGTGNTASAGQAVALGSNSTASGQNSFALGNAVVASGTGSVALGQSSTASHPYQLCMSDGVIAAGKGGSTCEEHLRGTGATASAIRVTADGATAGSANCVNIGIDHVASIGIILQVYDRTTPTVANWLSYYEPQGLLWIGNTNGTTAYTASGSASTKTAGTMSTATVSATADTTNGCLNLSFTPPAGNTDTLDVYATVKTTTVN